MNNITAKKAGRESWDGAWYAIFVNGEQLLENGQKVMYKTCSAENAVACHRQLEEARKTRAAKPAKA
jgi:hypothetical protein